MKKTYINPELEVVELKLTNNLLITSDTEKDGDYTPGDPVDAPANDWFSF